MRKLNIHSRFWCPQCGNKGDLMLSNNGEKEYSEGKSTNKYFCPTCCIHYKIDDSNNDFPITKEDEGKRYD